MGAEEIVSDGGSIWMRKKLQPVESAAVDCAAQSRSTDEITAAEQQEAHTARESS
jgi:hypothetical protein